MINYEIENELKQSLSSNEKLVWSGKPKTGIVFRSTDIFLIPFSFLWAGFALFWESTVIIHDAPILFKLWGIPFILVGLYVTIGRFFLDAKKRAGTTYGITANRIIIMSGIFNKEIKSLNIKTLSDITIIEKSDRSGTITFGPTDFRATMMEGFDWPGAKQPPKLDFIEEVKIVYDKIIDLQKQS